MMVPQPVAAVRLNELLGAPAKVQPEHDHDEHHSDTKYNPSDDMT